MSSDEDEDDESDEEGLDAASAGGGEKDVLVSVDLPIYQQARSLLAAAQQNPVHFVLPSVVVRFVITSKGDDGDEDASEGGCEVDPRIVRTLESIGVGVEVLGASSLVVAPATSRGADIEVANGTSNHSVDDISDHFGSPAISEQSNSQSQQSAVLPFQNNSFSRIPSQYAQHISDILNLDTTTLIALATDMVHRHETLPRELFLDESSNPAHVMPAALKYQYHQESIQPFLPDLLALFNGRRLVTTQTAFNKFQDILNTVAGPGEKRRARKMFVNATWEHAETLSDGEEADHEDQAAFLPSLIEVIPDSPSKRFAQLLIRKWDNPAIKPNSKKTPSSVQGHHVAVFGT
ncbi:hypothetical protein HK102_011077, partial [Quaeritorhiza haematococci]